MHYSSGARRGNMHNMYKKIDKVGCVVYEMYEQMDRQTR